MTNSTNLVFPSGQSVAQAKKDAKQLKKTLGCTQTEALNKIASRNGIDKPWDKAIEALKQTNVIELPLLNLLAGKQGEIWNQFVAPSLKLTDDRNVGIILGSSGTGKSILANQFMHKAIELGYTILYRDMFEVGNFTESTREHPEDTALNQCRQLARNNIDHFRFLSPNDTIPDAKPKTLLVIDEVAYHLRDGDDPLQVKLRDYINEGGLLLLIDQDNQSIENLLESELSIGFMALSGKYHSRSLNIEYPPELSRLLESYGRDTYSWLCTSHRGLAVGGSHLV